MQAYYWFTGIGAFLAILNTLFLIFDRVFRYRPIASITAARYGMRASATLRIKNTAPFDIIIERFTATPPYCAVSANNEVRAMADALSGSDVPIILGPYEERSLVLVVRDRSNISSDERFKIAVDWRRAESNWFRHPPVLIRTSVADIELREKAALNSPFIM